ncbi:hypothetical protein NHX12_033853 [Muraenolepis orangiensis]|uniref:Uncharacterized protein n=1 Tax=Muraenolepis orangiensis TaxID=630683 RepID=A0A9Q0E2J1_9TELE|nr:hypothetical protein NHX12_033853 [Muraenolepis orangiensis]
MLCVTALRSLRGFTSLSPAARCLGRGSRSHVSYVQGQSPEARIREYFYYIDHQGQLFLDDTKVKNFVTCFKDRKFLVFFFSRLRSNQSGRYGDHFPFLSLCGRERNFVRCDDRPLVFTHLLPPPPGGGPTAPGGEEPGPTAPGGEEPGPTAPGGEEAGPEMLSYCGGGEQLSAGFRPEALYMHPASGRVYHPCPETFGGVGLVRSALAIELSPFFRYQREEQEEQPTHFLWAGRRHVLTNELAAFFPKEGEGEGGSG